MKKSIVLMGIALVPFFVFGQNIPELEINPDFLKTNKNLDSVLQYTSLTKIDSNLLKKWEYHIDDEGLHQAKKYTWKDSTKEWIVTDKYEWEYNLSDKLTLKAHYDWPMPSGGWGGCDSEGCGKQEWAYDDNENQILWTQSYFSPSRKWEIFDKYENVYDHNNNQVLRSFMARGGDFTNFYWEGKKDEYSYDQNGNQTGQVKYKWASNHPLSGKQYSDWCPLYKEAIKYNQIGDTESRAFFNWDYKANTWISNVSFPNINRIEFQYDLEGCQIGITAKSNDSIIFKKDNTFYDNGLPKNIVNISEHSLLEEFMFFEQEWVVYNTLYDPQLVEYEYDSLNKVVLEKRKKWQFGSGSWIDSENIYYSYDSEGNLIEVLSIGKIRMGVMWYSKTKEQWEYDHSGLNTLHSFQYWSDESEEWIHDWKEVKSYDAMERLILEEFYTWDEDSIKWRGHYDRYWTGTEYIYPPGKIEYKYDDANNLVQYASYQWSDRRNNWIAYEAHRGKKEWQFDDNGRLFKEIGYDWDNESSAWIAKQQNVFQYDNMDDPVVQYQYAWGIESEGWELILKYFYYYSQASGIKDVPSPEISLFPNPASGHINITGLTQSAEVKIYSIQGQLMKSATMVEDVIDVSELSSGIYILSLTSGKETVVKKIVVEK